MAETAPQIQLTKIEQHQVSRSAADLSQLTATSPAVDRVPVALQSDANAQANKNRSKQYLCDHLPLLEYNE